MRVLSLALLFLPLAAQASLQVAPKHGVYGTVLVEAKDATGAWIEAGRLKYDFHYKGQTLSLPAAAAPSGELRVTFKDNDENQLDAASLSQDGRALALRAATESVSGQSLLKKLAAPDRDILEVGHDPVLVRFAAPQGSGELKFTLHARSASQHEFLGYPFWVRDTDGQQQVSYKMDAREGQALRIRSAILKSSSGHPSAPILGDFKIQDGRLRGSVDFGPDNDPGPDDYVTLVARDEKQEMHEFKVGMQPGKWGHVDYVYGPAATWQYMRFHFDVPLAELPQASRGSLGLELLAYGTACGNQDQDARVNSMNHFPVSPAVAASVTVTAYIGEGSGVFVWSAHSVSVTCVVVDGSGNTVLNQVGVGAINTCGNAQLNFVFVPDCPGSYVAYFNAIGNPDLNPNNGLSNHPFTVTGVCSTPTETPTSTETPVDTATPTFTATPSETGSSTMTASPSSSATASATPSQSQTKTPSSTVTVTGTATQTATDPQLTQTSVVLSYTPTPSPTPAFLKSLVDHVVVGPVPARAGQPICLGSNKGASSSNWEVYNTAGQRISSLGFGGENSQCMQTQAIAPGIYYVKVKVEKSGGGTEDRWQKISIVP